MELKNDSKGSGEEDKFVIKGREPCYIPEPKGIGYACYMYFKRYKHAIAQIDGITGVKDTYGSFLKRCIRTAVEMQARGVTSNDIISICSFNHLNSCVPVIATMFLGAKLSCLDSMLSLRETVNLIKQTCPKLVFVGVESIELMEKAIAEAELYTKIVVFGVSEVHWEFTDFIAPGADQNFRPFEVENNKNTALILFSSGSTGMPKGMCISHYGLLGQAANVVNAGFNLTCMITYVSFYWMSTYVVALACMMTGGCRLVLPRYNPMSHWKLLHQFKVTFAYMLPTQAIAIYKRGRPEGIDTKNLSDIMLGGAPLAGEHVEKIRDIFPGTHVALAFGQTECSGLGLYFEPNKRIDVLAMYKKPGSCGRPVHGTKCKVVDIETEENLGPNQRGELRIKSEYWLNGLYNRDSSDVWDTNGWLKTGDVAYYDEDVCFYVVDRIKDLLKFHGYHVIPTAIEGVILHHPKVAAVVVVGIPNIDDGDHLAAAVVLKDPNDTVSTDEIIKYVEERVHDRERLRGGVKFIEKLPVTATGKIRRMDVRKLFLEGNN